MIRKLSNLERTSLRRIERRHGFTFTGGSVITDDEGNTTYHLGYTFMGATVSHDLAEHLRQFLGADRMILDVNGRQYVAS